jgi:ribonuclease BN (tRNA processing enzyme)
MKITVLGAGSAFNFAMGNVSYLVEEGACQLLIDCGSEVPRALQKHRIIDKVTDVVLSHCHSDHIGGVELLAQIRYFYHLKKQGVPVPRLWLTSFMEAKVRLLEQLGLGRIQDDNGRPLRASLETYFDMRILPNHSSFGEYVGPGRELSVRPIQVDHVPVPSFEDFPSYGFIVKQYREIPAKKPIGGDPDEEPLTETVSTSVVFSCDTREPIDRKHGGELYCAELIFHDCQLFDDGAGDVHVSLDRMVRDYPEKYRAKTWLTHYGGTLDASHQARATGAGFAGFAEPGQVIEI